MPRMESGLRVFWPETQMKPMPLGAWPTCDALWRDFAHATAEHVKLLQYSQISGVKHDLNLAARTEDLITAAEARRSDARRSVRSHEAAAHS
jgi:hypothetical protein